MAGHGHHCGDGDSVGPGLQRIPVRVLWVPALVVVGRRLAQQQIIVHGQVVAPQGRGSELWRAVAGVPQGVVGVENGVLLQVQRVQARWPYLLTAANNAVIEYNNYLFKYENQLLVAAPGHHNIIIKHRLLSIGRQLLTCHRGW